MLDCLTPPGNLRVGHSKQSRSGRGPTRTGPKIYLAKGQPQLKSGLACQRFYACAPKTFSKTSKNDPKVMHTDRSTATVTTARVKEPEYYSVPASLDTAAVEAGFRGLPRFDIDNNSRGNLETLPIRWPTTSAIEWATAGGDMATKRPPERPVIGEGSDLQVINPCAAPPGTRGRGRRRGRTRGPPPRG